MSVVDEALGDEDQRLASGEADERFQRPLERPERDPVAGGGREIDLGRPARDVGVLDRPGPSDVRALLRRRHQAGGLEAALDPVHDHRIAEHVDAHRLVLGNPIGAGLGNGAALEVLHEVDHLVLAGLHAGAPAGSASGRHQRDAVAFARLLPQELRYRRLGPLGGERGQVDVVEGDHERAPPPLALPGGVGGDRGPRDGLLGGGGGDLDGVEAHDRLRHAVLVHLQVFLPQAGDGLPFLVGHHDVDGDLLDVGGERGRGLLGAGGPGRSRAPGQEAGHEKEEWPRPPGHASRRPRPP